MTDRNVIHCQTLNEMATLIAAFIREGVTFKADTGTMTITMLGGY
jgi:DeoR/GlpR family transcriptional regulator of sugar metabolism